MIESGELYGRGRKADCALPHESDSDHTRSKPENEHSSQCDTDARIDGAHKQNKAIGDLGGPCRAEQTYARIIWLDDYQSYC